MTHIHSYSFALYPETYTPSGRYNMSRVDDIYLTINESSFQQSETFSINQYINLFKKPKNEYFNKLINLWTQEDLAYNKKIIHKIFKFFFNNSYIVNTY